MKLAFLCIFLLSTAISSAQAARISFVGGWNSSEPNTAGTDYEGLPALGVGALLEFRLVPLVGLEFGALHLPRKHEYKSTIPRSVTFTVNQKMLQFPVMIRAHLGNVLSLGVGGYYATYQGDVEITSTSPNGTSYTYIQERSAYNHTTTDYGLVTSAALYMKIVPLTRLLIDGRYTLGVKNNKIAGGEMQYNDLQLLLGIQFGF